MTRQSPAPVHDWEPPFGSDPSRFTRRLGSGTGSGRSSIWLNSEKIAALAPIPNASERTATAVTNGVLNSVRSASLKLPMNRLKEAYLGQNRAAERLQPITSPAVIRIRPFEDGRIAHASVV